MFVALMFTNIDTVDSLVNLYVESDSQSNHGYPINRRRGLYRRFERHCEFDRYFLNEIGDDSNDFICQITVEVESP
jgi:hypothetical protein